MVTAWRISKTKEFKDEYRNARWEALSQSLARLQQASGAAVSALLKVMIERPLLRRAASAPPTVCWITPAGPRRSKTSRPGLLNWSVQRIRPARAPKANDFSGHTRGNVVLREEPGPGKATITTEGRFVQ